jgi:hypothetical protein
MECVQRLTRYPPKGCTPPAGVPPKGEKLYDITVPATLNFGIANGLMLYDTSRTGYIQRRLELAMNDMTVEYDGTVRKSDGSIIQYQYGSDGFGAEYLVKCRLTGIEKSSEEFRKSLHFPYEVYRKIVQNPRRNEKAIFQKVHEREVERLSALHEILNRSRRTLLLSMWQQPELNIWLPVNINHEIFSVLRGGVRPSGAPCGPRVDYVFEKIEDLVSKYCADNLSSEYYVRYHLASRWVYEKHRLTDHMFDTLVGAIAYCFRRALVHPGEMVGSLAAEDIGEPATQMTLNSVEWNTEIVVIESDNPVRAPIGKWIDEKMIRESDRIQYIPENRTQYLELKEVVYVPTATNEGIASWERLTAVTRHLPVGDLVRVRTRSGCEITATQQKSFLIWEEEKQLFVPKDGLDLKIGDFIPTARDMKPPPFISEGGADWKKNYDSGWVEKAERAYRVQNDMVLDPIVSKEFCKSEYEHVYDVTVPKTLNFMCANGMLCLDTFHSAGQGAKAVTSGVPRIQELLTLSKKIKTPIMTLGLCQTLRRDETVLGRFQTLLVDTMLEDIVESNASMVVWDPDPRGTLLEDETDQALVSLHEPFQPVWPENPNDFPHSRWVIRLELNKEALIDRGLLPPYVATDRAGAHESAESEQPLHVQQPRHGQRNQHAQMDPAHSSAQHCSADAQLRAGARQTPNVREKRVLARHVSLAPNDPSRGHRGYPVDHPPQRGRKGRDGHLGIQPHRRVGYRRTRLALHNHKRRSRGARDAGHRGRPRGPLPRVQTSHVHGRRHPQRPPPHASNGPHDPQRVPHVHLPARIQ